MKMKKPEPHPLQHMLVKEPTEPIYASNPQEVFDFCHDLTNLPQEGVFVLLLNSKNRILQRRLVTYGILDASYVHPREVFRDAIKTNAKSLIIVHNHPTGEPDPSLDDIRITQKMNESGIILGINLLDHVIIGNGKYHSIRDYGEVTFS